QVLDQRGVLVGGVVYLRDGLVDLLEPARLVDRGGGYLRYDLGHAADRLDDFIHGLLGLYGLLGANVHAVDRFIDQGFDVLGGGRAFVRQAAYLARHHGKAAPGIAGTG